MSTFCCISDLTRFMMKEADKMIKGYVHENDIFIFHDDLVLMIVKETITWMKENNYFHHWLLPMNGLQDGRPYSVCPVGNITERMSLYNSLNRDILHIFHFHCVLSRFVIDGKGTDEEERNMRFSFSTPK